MKADLAIERSGYSWFIGAGLVAVSVSLFLIWADSALTHSISEQILSNTLYELRTAQSSLPSEVSDRRQHGAADLSAPAKRAAKEGEGD